MGKESVLKTFLIIVFYVMSVYIFSSWWCWYYGAGMGQRVMIDHYILLGFLLLITLQNAPKLLKRILVGVMGVLVIVNVIQTAQIKKGIYKSGSPTKEIYWDNFLSLTRKAKVYEKSDWILINEKYISFNPNDNVITKGTPKQNQDVYFIQTNEQETYSPSFKVNLDEPSQKLVLSFTALAQSQISESRLVISSIEDHPQTKVIYLKDFMVINSPTQMEYLLEFEIKIMSFEAYFWNGNTKEVVDYSNLSVESY
jgi:hypothetical protein